MSLNQFNNIIKLLNSKNIFYKNNSKHISYLNNIKPIVLSKFFFSNYIVKQKILNKNKVEPEIHNLLIKINELKYDDFKANLYELKNQVFALIAQGMYSKEFDFIKSSELISSTAFSVLIKIYKYSLMHIKENIENEIVLIALGKLGGFELNFCSDVDLVFLKTNSLEDSIAIKFVRFFLDTAALIFKIDLNLRPGGVNSKIIHSNEEAINYYRGWGSAWEKIALLKSRYIYGNKVLYDEFLSNIKDFVFKKYLDYTCIEEYRTIKKLLYIEKINYEVFNLKKDVGGIRYLEFYAAILLLIFSGRIENLKKFSLSFLDTVLLLYKNKIIKKSEYYKLKNNYIYLRDLENIIQSINNYPTHELSKEELKVVLYIKYDYDFLNKTQYYFDMHNKIIKENNDFFVELLKEEIEINNYYSNEIIQSIINKINNSYVANDIKNKIIKLIFYIQEKKFSNIDSILNRLDVLIEKLKTKLSVLLIFYENPKLLDNLIKMLAKTDYFFEELVKYPELLDLFILDFEDDKLNYKTNLKNSLNNFINKEDDINLRFEKLKLFKTFEELVSYNYLEHNLKNIMLRLSYTARLIIVNICSFLNFKEHNFCVFAKGGLGDNSMIFNSDLDLIFIVDTSSYKEYELLLNYAKKINNLISLKGKYGSLYNIDNRLNQENNFILTNFSNFIDYYNNNSNFIDKISLWKLSYIWGDKKLAKKILKFKYKYLKNIFKDNLLNMNYKAEIFKYRINFSALNNFKYKPGSLMDLEYLYRFYQCRDNNFVKNISNFNKFSDFNYYYEKLKKYEIYITIREKPSYSVENILKKVEEEFIRTYG